jgi:hypothetical protein
LHCLSSGRGEGFRIKWPDGYESWVPPSIFCWAGVWRYRAQLLLGDRFVIAIGESALLVFDSRTEAAVRVELMELETHPGEEREVILGALSRTATR